MGLDRKISDQRIYPAVDIFLSCNGAKSALATVGELEKINLIRRGLAGHNQRKQFSGLLLFVKKFPTQR